jgi:hypothetical protein
MKTLPAIFSAVLATLTSSIQAHAIGSEAKVTWLKSASEIPATVRAKIKDCTYIAENTEEAWEENNESGGMFFSPAKGQTIYIVTCELAASNVFDAAVLVKNGKATRLKFSMLDENNKMITETTIGNSQYGGNGKLTGGVLAGCVGSVGTTMTYHLKGNQFVLAQQEANSNCEKPNWQVIFPKKK